MSLYRVLIRKTSVILHTYLIEHDKLCRIKIQIRVQDIRSNVIFFKIESTYSSVVSTTDRNSVCVLKLFN